MSNDPHSDFYKRAGNRRRCVRAGADHPVRLAREWTARRGFRCRCAGGDAQTPAGWAAIRPRLFA